MEASNVLHMASGDGESSYAKNSLFQEIVIRKTLPILKEAIKGFANHDVFFSQCFKIADLGCSSGPNTLLSATNIIDIVHEECKQNNRKTPQFQVSLVDLIGNDFNTVFGLLPNFYAKLKEAKGKKFGPCFVSAAPGSFYDRLFPDESLHLVYSSYSVHWLSQVPEGLENNTSNIYFSKTSPPNVFEAYQKQYASDFTKLLQVRSKEVVSGGRMVLTLVGRSFSDPTIDDCVVPWELLTLSLLDLVKEGLVRESDITSFNIPIYNPCEDEIKTIVENEGSFSLDSITTIRENWLPYDTEFTNMCAFKEFSHRYGENAKKLVRDVMEPLLASHFGSSIIEKLFNNFAKHMSESLDIKKARHSNNIVISVIKK
ncbi:benzoate carboxyl methyltransferase [Artemisia annua]|uniref:Benzoate carboxyl methyltransferase n=1 Tax=Artemisia annua TaxID=35608 RepID=A0A2U1QAE4_ARTAN|nr:benzoate carboxyl methyltransferase [Artemisia annua]